MSLTWQEGIWGTKMLSESEEFIQNIPWNLWNQFHFTDIFFLQPASLCSRMHREQNSLLKTLLIIFSSYDAFSSCVLTSWEQHKNKVLIKGRKGPEFSAVWLTESTDHTGINHLCGAGDRLLFAKCEVLLPTFFTKAWLLYSLLSHLNYWIHWTASKTLVEFI